MNLYVLRSPLNFHGLTVESINTPQREQARSPGESEKTATLRNTKGGGYLPDLLYQIGSSDISVDEYTTSRLGIQITQKIKVASK